MTETAWLIERWFGRALKYWNGRPLERAGGEMDQSHAWTEKHDDALRFAREQDAQVVLDRMLGGEGRAVQHAWIRGDAPFHVDTGWSPTPGELK